MLQVVEHALEQRPRDIDGEGAERESRDFGIEQEGDVEAGEAAQRSEDKREEGFAAPDIIGREDRHYYSADPDAGCEEDY